MFCPHCGIDEQQPKQYCRACGADLRLVRMAMNRADDFSATAISAREEIGHAFALKIKELKSARDLKKIAEDALPQIEKFLESPEEKRLRRLRAGVTTTVIGVATILMGLTLANTMNDKDWGMIGGMGFVPLLIGIGMVLNGLLFSLPRNRSQEILSDSVLPNFISQKTQSQVITNELLTPENLASPSSVTEHTTHKLPKRERQSF